MRRELLTTRQPEIEGLEGDNLVALLRASFAKSAKYYDPISRKACISHFVHVRARSASRGGDKQ
ncbi:hypothetical protein ABH907_003763 [Pseudomonas frederiksbergensis]|uniref:hypothetical protein n=1 Tax=Pseudomonas frederiksbergensis TaxID=104087 RepID=UPI003D21FD4D